MKKINIKLFLIPFLIMFFVFTFFGYRAISSRIQENYNHLEEDANIIAKNYSQLLSKSIEASEVINQLLEEKILSAGKTAELYKGQESNQLLKELAERLNVDVMYFYNEEGKLIYSSTYDDIGWTPENTHPVMVFFNSDKKTFIEPIRKDTFRDLFMKFGYYRLENGTIYQIGVQAEHIQKFISSFEIQKILDNIYNKGVVDGILFYDTNDTLQASTGITEVDSKLYHEAKASVGNGEEILGTLAIIKSAEEFNNVTKKFFLQGIGAFLALVFSLTWVMRIIYKQSKKYYNLAYFDQLTGLPNYDYLTEFLASKKAKESDNNQALFLISLRNLKNLNLTYGFKFGEEIIVEVADRLKNLIGTNGLVFKYNVDQFALFIESYTDVNDLLIIAEQITGTIEEPFSGSLGNQYINPAIGILELGGDSCTPDMAIKNVFTAMTIAKKNPYHSFVFYDEEMEKKLKREDKIEKALRKAVEDKNYPCFYLEYQPKLNLRNNSIAGFEALARLELDEFGKISPVEFIDVAERSLLISELGKRIYSKSIDFIHKMEEEGFPGLKVAINISGIQLTDENFPNFEIEGDKVEFEITESVLLDNFDRVNEKLSELRRKGVTISLDDFGTGFSSMSRLRDLNIDILKIDKFFIDRIGRRDVDQRELISSDIISMAHKLGLKVVAEGVENQLQKDFLINNNCDIIQGYYYSKPLSEDAAIEFLNKEYKK